MEMLWTIFYVIFLGIVSHFYGQALPRRWFDPEKFPYRAFAFEKTVGSIGIFPFRNGRTNCRI